MFAISVDEMKSLENRAISEYGIPSIVLMENAAMGFVWALVNEYGDLARKKILVICGKGNNAGDGYAIARLLYFKGIDVSVLPIFDIDSLTDDAKINALAAKNMGVPFIKDFTCEYDIIIDAIFGTGFHGEIVSPVKEIIEKINKSTSFVASVDVPSGVELQDGAKNDFFAKSDICITFGYAKFHQFTGINKSAFKKLIVAPISIPAPESFSQIITKNTSRLIPKREKISHKGTFGKVMAIVGSSGMAGAAILSGSAVLKSGAGMLTIATDESIIPTIAQEFPSAMSYILPDDCSELINKAKGMDAVLIGCGLGVSDDTKKIITEFIRKCEIPMIIDADGLNILSENTDIIKNKKVILTPHIVEFSRLTKVSPDEIKENPTKVLNDFCKTFGVTVILKDSVTLISAKGEQSAVCHAPNSGMATAGSGDVLAGVVTSLTAQGLSPFDASCCGVYIHSAAGKLAKDSLGEAGMMSSDILSFVPKAFVEKVDITPHIKEL